MENLHILEMKVQKIRNMMHELIEEKKDLLDPEIIYISQTLDKILNEYHRLKKNLEKYDSKN